MQNCPMCFSEISDDNPALVAEQINKANVNWWRFSDKSEVGKTLTIDGVGSAEVVAFKGYDGPPGWNDCELPQGTEFEAYVVLKVGEHFFRKSGLGNSYNDITWAGDVRPVIPKEKTVVVYDF